MIRRTLLVLGSIVLSALSAAGQEAETSVAVPPVVQQNFGEFRPEAVRAHTRYLSSDLLEGRGPGTRGDALATSYIAAQFEALGLAPAGAGGSFFQKVPLLGITTNAERSRLAFRGADGAEIGPLSYREQFVGGNQSQLESVKLDSDVVFVGHGVVAPEYGWDDYKGLDVRGKTLVMLVDDPPATEKEPDLFKGRARTYYGRWTYKYEIGAGKGAQAVILIHTAEAAGYGWQVVRNSWTGEQAYVKLAEGKPGLAFAGWISESTARELFSASGLDLKAMIQAASSRKFKPVPLRQKLTGEVVSTIRPFETANVVARLEGSDPALRDEAVLYTAHHDHLGVGTPDDDNPSDTIYNGAIDNATGTATLLELARVWSRTSPRPKRSILFAAVAAEEQGLLGSEYLGEHPPIPASRIALGLNYDALHLYGEVGSVTLVGAEQMTFYPAVQQVTSAMGLRIIPDQAPEQGSYYRSDHFSLARVGVPAFSIRQGLDVKGKPADWGRQQSSIYREKHYHQASDEFDPSWDFTAAVQAARLGWWLGWEAANAPQLPQWVEGGEFRREK